MNKIIEKHNIEYIMIAHIHIYIVECGLKALGACIYLRVLIIGCGLEGIFGSSTDGIIGCSLNSG